MGRKRRRRLSGKLKILLIGVGVVWFALEGRFYFPKFVRPPKGATPVVVEMETTSYCHCRKCCSYKWLAFIPYQKTGTFSWRIKHIGVTSSGAKVGPGTLAADTSLYPYGTIMHIPGYGYGRVEDTGGAIKGKHIDLYRPNHWFARSWGVKKRKVKVWLPPKEKEEGRAKPSPQL
jgi:3D (Asp-Asp-Asp) domain-containing protein